MYSDEYRFCTGVCLEVNEAMDMPPYSTVANYCSECGVFMFTTSNKCQCCSIRLQIRAKKRKN
jgi:hypothetical protein